MSSDSILSSTDVAELSEVDEYDESLARTLETHLTGHVPDDMAYRLAVEYDDVREILGACEDGGNLVAHEVEYGLSYAHTVRDALRDYVDSRPVIQLAAVGCSGSKNDVDERVPAADLYRGAYWTVKSRFAESVSDDWRIISAEHSLLRPDEEIHHYERTPEDLEGVPIHSDEELPNGDPVETLLDSWALRVHRELRKWVETAAGSAVAPRDVQLAVFLGQKYERPLDDRGVFDLEDTVASEVAVRFPWRSADLSGNGEQMSWMNAEAENGGGDS